MPDSCNQPFYVFNLHVFANNSIALGVEGDRADRRPVSSVSGPACRVSLAGLEIRLMTCSQDRLVLQRMTLCRGDVADTAVAVLEVVPAYEVGAPAAGILKGGEAVSRASELSPAW